MKFTAQWVERFTSRHTLWLCKTRASLFEGYGYAAGKVRINHLLSLVFVITIDAVFGRILCDREYRNAGILNSEDLTTVISKHDSNFCNNIVGDAALIFGILGCSLFVATFMNLFTSVFPDIPVSRPTSSIQHIFFLTFRCQLLWAFGYYELAHFFCQHGSFATGISPNQPLVCCFNIY